MRYALAVQLWWIWATLAWAQQTAWVQVEAQPTLAEAEAAAQRYARQLDGVQGFRLGRNWYAVVLGPYAEPAAEAELQRLRAAGAIPRDSFVSDGTRFGDRFWPVGRAAQAPSGFSDAGPQETASADATTVEARRAERLLTRQERQQVQTALEWAGFYAGAIDAAFGSGTRAAMRAWQQANGYEPTGVLTASQRAELVGAYRAVLDELDFETVRDSRAGIEIALPLAAVSFDRYDAPFARYTSDDGPAQVLLISQGGDAATLGGLYEIMQTLEIVPPDGPRQRGARSFTLEGRDDEIVSTTYAELVQGAIKGYTLVWPAGDEPRRRRVLEEMRATFSRLPGVLPDPAGADTAAPDLLAGLELRRPERVRTGFFVDDDGRVLTTREAVAGCGHLTLRDETEMEPVATDEALGVALLTPRDRLAPVGHARFRAGDPLPRSEVAAAGYPFGGRLPAPTLTFGTLADLSGPEGETGVRLLALATRDGDGGGPVFDTGGAVLGMLLPRQPDARRRLPDDVSFAAGSAALAEFLTRNGVPAATAEAAASEIAPEDLTRRAADMTVAVQCWD